VFALKPFKVAFLFDRTNGIAASNNESRPCFTREKKEKRASTGARIKEIAYISSWLINKPKSLKTFE